MKNYIFATLILAILSTTGCAIFPKPETTKIHYYSLDIPKKSNVNHVIQIASVIPMGNNSQDMLFKRQAGVVEVDSINNWIMPPSSLVERYLTLSLSPKNYNTKKMALQLRAKLLLFESNLSNKTTTISILVTLRRNKKIKSEKLYTATVNVQGDTASAYAVSMSQTMEQISQQIVSEINNIR